jgi:hypothetical protein
VSDADYATRAGELSGGTANRGHKTCGERVGQIQSLIATCVLHGIAPYTYLVDVLQRIESHPQSQFDELTPRLWKDRFADRPMTSAIDPKHG